MRWYVPHYSSGFRRRRPERPCQVRWDLEQRLAVARRDALQLQARHDFLVRAVAQRDRVRHFERVAFPAGACPEIVDAPLDRVAHEPDVAELDAAVVVADLFRVFGEPEPDPKVLCVRAFGWFAVIVQVDLERDRVPLGVSLLVLVVPVAREMCGRIAIGGYDQLHRALGGSVLEADFVVVCEVDRQRDANLAAAVDGLGVPDPAIVGGRDTAAAGDQCPLCVRGDSPNRFGGIEHRC